MEYNKTLLRQFHWNLLIKKFESSPISKYCLVTATEYTDP